MLKAAVRCHGTFMEFQHFGDWGMKNEKFETACAMKCVQGHLGLYRRIVSQKLSKQIKNQEDNKTKYFVSTIQGLDSQSNKYSWRDNCLIGKQISENYPNIAVRLISWRNKRKRKTIVKHWGLAKVNSGYHIVQKFHKSSGM